MRFNAKGPARLDGEAEALQRRLAAHGVQLHVIDVRAGCSITSRVFEVMERCDAFLAFGTADYGERTGNPAATDCEVAYWQGCVAAGGVCGGGGGSRRAQQRPLIPLRMISFDGTFDHLTARLVFCTNALSLQWLLGEPCPASLVQDILKALGLRPLA
jgi:hypothetical protein